MELSVNSMAFSPLSFSTPLSCGRPVSSPPSSTLYKPGCTQQVLFRGPFPADEGTVEYWRAKTMRQIRKSAAYSHFPPHLNKSGLRKDPLCKLLSCWCAKQGRLYRTGSYEYWSSMPVWALELTDVYQQLPRIQTERKSKAELCRVLRDAYLCSTPRPRSFFERLSDFLTGRANGNPSVGGVANSSTTPLLH